MKKFEENFRHLSKKTRMTAAEKDAMRAYLLEYRSMKPMPPEFHRAARPPGGIFPALFARPAALIGAVAFLFATGGGVAFAAEGSLPGDVLYPVKVGVVEKVEGALAVTAEAKANFEITLANRRLTEAETLATKGRLSPDEADELAARFTADTENAANDIASVRARNPGGAAVAETKLSAVLSTHADILGQVSASSSARARLESAIALQTAAHGVSALATARASAPSTASSGAVSGTATGAPVSSSSPEPKPAVNALKKAAEHSQTEASSTLEALVKSGGIPSDVQADAEASLAASAMALTEGDAAFSSGNFDEAYAKYQAALSDSEALTLRLRASASLKIPSVVIRPPVSAQPGQDESSPTSHNPLPGVVNPGTIMKVTPPAPKTDLPEIENSNSSSFPDTPPPGLPPAGAASGGWVVP